MKPDFGIVCNLSFFIFFTKRPQIALNEPNKEAEKGEGTYKKA